MAWDGVERRKKVDINYEDCPLGIRHETEINVLKESSKSIASDVKEIKEKLLNRPSWSATIIISFLSTLAFSALTFAFTVLQHLPH